MSRHPNIHFYDLNTAKFDLLAEVRKGFKAKDKYLPPALLYDKYGSELFDEITGLPEYYITRAEVTILRENAGDIANVIGNNCLIIEPGSGSCKKIRLILPHIEQASYMPMDVSKEFLLEAAELLIKDFPKLTIYAVCADFTQDLRIPFSKDSNTRATVFFPGSTIGNYEPDEILQLLKKIAGLVAPKGGVLIGVDLKKDPAVLEAAYNDVQGVTAEFSLNLLNRLNHELNANFQLQLFQHKAQYNKKKSRIEIHLISLADQEVTIAGQGYFFPKASKIHTENSYKFTVEEFQALAAKAGFKAHKLWLDKNQLFSIHYFELNS